MRTVTHTISIPYDLFDEDLEHEGLWTRMVPKGYYFDGCNPDSDGGIVKLTRTREYSTAMDSKGLWAIERRIGNGFASFSDQRFDTALDAAIKLKKGGLTYTCFFINDLYKETSSCGL